MSQQTVDERIQTACLVILATTAVGATLWWLQAVFVPFVLSLFIALGLSPLIDYLTTKLRVPKWAAVLLTLILAVTLLTLAAMLVMTSAQRLATNAPTYQALVLDQVDSALANLPLQDLGVNPDELLSLPLNAISTAAISITNAIVSLVSQGSIVLIFLMFLLLGGSAYEAPANSMWVEVKKRVQKYVAFKFMISAFTGILVGIILSVLGIELAMAFGLMAFLLNFIPSIGSIVATLLPLPVVLVSPDLSTMTMFLAIALPGAIQLTIGNVIEPMVMGDELDLHPVTILLALMVWGTLWGIVGMLLATPITSMMKILLERGERTRPIANLFAGRLDGLNKA